MLRSNCPNVLACAAPVLALTFPQNFPHLVFDNIPSCERGSAVPLLHIRTALVRLFLLPHQELPKKLKFVDVLIPLNRRHSVLRLWIALTLLFHCWWSSVRAFLPTSIAVTHLTPFSVWSFARGQN